MATTLGRTSPTTPGQPAGRAGPGARRTIPPRSRSRVAGGAALLMTAAALAFLVYNNIGDRQPVLAVTQIVDPGERIAPDDLEVVMVAVDAGVATVPAAQRDAVIGQRATVRLTPRSLLTPAAFADRDAVPDGYTRIGALVRVGQSPLGLRAGDAVEVVVPGDPDADRPVPAVIFAVSSSSGADGRPISLAVPEAEARRLATAGSEGRLILMVPSP